MILGRFMFVLGLTLLVSLPAVTGCGQNDEGFELAEGDMETEGQDVSIDNSKVMDSMDANEDDDMDELTTDTDELSNKQKTIYNEGVKAINLMRFRACYYKTKRYYKTKKCEYTTRRLRKCKRTSPTLAEDMSQNMAEGENSSQKKSCSYYNQRYRLCATRLRSRIIRRPLPIVKF